MVTSASSDSPDRQVMVGKALIADVHALALKIPLRPMGSHAGMAERAARTGYQTS